MPLLDILKKKEKVAAQQNAHSPDAAGGPPALGVPEFTFMRSDTNTQEILYHPSITSEESSKLDPTADRNSTSKTSRLFKGRSRSSSAVSAVSASGLSDSRPKSPKRLSQLLHIRKSDNTSANVPSDLPEIKAGDGQEGGEGTESQWEKRATMLAMGNEISRSRPRTPSTSNAGPEAALNSLTLGAASGGEKGVVSEKTDDNIQEAIRLHEAGDLATATRMFGRLADPNGENNALSQVLYGLALRHGWGCAPNAAEAVQYLSAAASNAASVEDLALQAGMKKGGNAKGELVLAIFELGNCFRHGWGVSVDKVAAKQYYETAANLGDTDAMNEVAWCYIEGFGCKKDKQWGVPHALSYSSSFSHSDTNKADILTPKWAAAKYYRLAEKAGSKTLGNSWIWKEKYDAPKKK
ncbi:HCP-like protein [Venustampulla echinocandica]|uniref:HCP-like protein n=1 Tax=Venustampulla echinocandica TaxID=2656787 RepID=A0A370TSL1_9HELO|nr:HCP-like protein [Venustampulla echinocandica]RDL38522.1 HCP-like protein [Venustampulla echinocandica]